MDKQLVDMKPELVEKLKQEYGLDPEDEWDKIFFDFEKLDYFNQYELKALLLCHELEMLKNDNKDSITIPVSAEIIEKVIDVLSFIDNLKLKEEEDL